MTTRLIEGIVPDALAQEIRRVDGNHSLGAGALAEALAPFINASLLPVLERLEALRGEWLQTASDPVFCDEYDRDHIAGYNTALADCADELDAILNRKEEPL